MDSPDDATSNLPAPPPTDADRQAMVDRIQQALAADLVAFEEVDERFAAIYRAETLTELERVAADLPRPPQPPPPVTGRHLAPSQRFTLIGDTKIGGWLTFEGQTTVTAGIGDTTVDLSSALIGPDGVVISVRRLIGAVKVIVPDGARVQVEDITLIGDRREILTPPSVGGPTVRIRVFGLIGDVRVYSLSQVPEGPLRRLWAALRGGQQANDRR